MKRKQYQVISPDGFTIEHIWSYPSKKKAWDAFTLWKKQYLKQGYYSSVKYGRIPLVDLGDYCTFNII